MAKECKWRIRVQCMWSLPETSLGKNIPSPSRDAYTSEQALLVVDQWFVLSIFCRVVEYSHFWVSI